MSLINTITSFFGSKNTDHPMLAELVAVPAPGHLATDVVYFDGASFTNVHNAISDFLVAPIGKGNHIEALMNGVQLKAHSYKTVSNALGNDVYPKLMAFLKETYPDAVLTPNVSYENDMLQTFYINVTKESVKHGRRVTTFLAHVYGATSANFIAMILPSHVEFTHSAFFEQFKPPREYVIQRFNGERTTTVRLTKEKCVVYPEFYPNLGMPPEEFAKAFYDSNSSTLIMMGEAGTGKSTLARSFLNYSTGKFILVDNPTVYTDPKMFSALQALVEEEAANGQVTLFLDEIDQIITMEKEKDPTGTLARLLSMSSGIIELNLKIVVGSNVMNKNKLNEALVRGGRTFSVIDFGRMTPAEANKARACLNRPAVDFLEDVTLGDALNFTNQGEVKATKRAGVGFM